MQPDPSDQTDTSDTRAFAQLVRNSMRDLRLYLRARLGNREDAEDLAQETFFRVWRGAPDEHGNGGNGEALRDPRAFLFHIANNLLIDRARKAGRRRVVDADIASRVAETGDRDEASPERVLAAREQLAVLSTAIDALPPACRRVFIMKRFDELSHAEIAATLGVSKSMVEKHIAEAMLRLKLALAAQERGRPRLVHRRDTDGSP